MVQFFLSKNNIILLIEQLEIMLSTIMYLFINTTKVHGQAKFVVLYLSSWDRLCFFQQYFVHLKLIIYHKVQIINILYVAKCQFCGNREEEKIEPRLSLVGIDLQVGTTQLC